MRIAGVDPGTETSHYVVFDPHEKRVVEVGSLPNSDMLDVLRAHGLNIYCLGSHLAIESMDARGMRLGKDTLETILWIGRFQEASGGVLVPRSAVKDVLCGHQKADDAAIRLVLIDRLGKPGTSKNPGPTFGCSGHKWQALAVAVTHYELLTRSPIPKEGP